MRENQRFEVFPMLFRNDIPKDCAYGAHGTPIDGDKILCIKKGVIAADKPCWKFKYDPCKRVPAKAKALNFEKYKEEDFSL